MHAEELRERVVHDSSRWRYSAELRDHDLGLDIYERPFSAAASRAYSFELHVDGDRCARTDWLFHSRQHAFETALGLAAELLTERLEGEEVLTT